MPRGKKRSKKEACQKGTIQCEKSRKERKTGKMGSGKTSSAKDGGTRTKVEHDVTVTRLRECHAGGCDGIRVRQRLKRKGGREVGGDGTTGGGDRGGQGEQIGTASSGKGAGRGRENAQKACVIGILRKGQARGGTAAA